MRNFLYSDAGFVGMRRVPHGITPMGYFLSKNDKFSFSIT